MLETYADTIDIKGKVVYVTTGQTSTVSSANFADVERIGHHRSTQLAL